MQFLTGGAGYNPYNGRKMVVVVVVVVVLLFIVAES